MKLDLRLVYAAPALLLALSCSKKEQAAEQVIRPVRVHQVALASGARSRTLSGTAKAGTESKLSFKIPGTINQLPIKVGDRVKKGQRIANLDDNDTRLQVGEAQAALAQATAQSRNAQAEYARVRRLYENRGASLKDLDAARANADSAQAGVSAARQRVRMARSQLQYCTLNAPEQGEIASVPVEKNENVNAGQPVAVLNSGALPEVTIAMPESLIVNVSQGDKATVAFDAIVDKTFNGVVTEVGVAAAGDTTFPVVVRLAAAHQGIRAGMAAEVTIQFGKVDTKQRIFVPSHAVLEDTQGRFAYVLADVKRQASGPVGTIARKKVAIGRLSAEGIEISSGLAAGDLVVVGGLRFVELNMKVRGLNN